MCLVTLPRLFVLPVMPKGNDTRLLLTFYWLTSPPLSPHSPALLPPHEMPLKPDYPALKALHPAVCANNWDLIKAFLEADPGLLNNGDYKVRTGSTLLHHAAFYGNLDALRWLVEERGCNIAARDSKGGTLLCHATLFGLAANVPVVEYLFTHHAPEDADHLMENVQGLGTAEERRLELITCVLRYTTRGSLNYLDDRFYAPLASACIKGYAKIVRLLLLAGAEAYETYPFGATNAVEWDPGNRNALLKAQAVFRNDSAEKRTAKLRCVALIEVGDWVGNGHE